MERKATRKRCLVAGGSGNIGGAVAREFARRGWIVGVHYYTGRDRAERTCSDCGAGSFVLGADLRTRAGAEGLVEEFVRQGLPPPGCVVVATGIVRDAPLLRVSESDWEETMAVNLTGPAHLLRAVALRWKETGGHAILVGSFAGLTGREGGAAYSASKAALVGLARTAARELGPRGVRVNVAVPPFVPSPEGMGAKASGAFVEHARRMSVTGRLGSAEEFAEFVVNLAETKGVSGQVLVADSRIA